MSAEIIIAEWPKNSRETLRIRLDSFKDQAIVDCRAWYATGDSNLKPGRGGLTVSIRHLSALASALAKAVEVANAAELFQATALKPIRSVTGRDFAPARASKHHRTQNRIHGNPHGPEN